MKFRVWSEDWISTYEQEEATSLNDAIRMFIEDHPDDIIMGAVILEEEAEVLSKEFRDSLDGELMLLVERMTSESCVDKKYALKTMYDRLLHILDPL